MQSTQKFGLKLLLVKEFWSLPVEHSVDPTTLQASTQLWMHFHAENPFVKHILPALPEINTKLRQTKAFLISPGLLAEMLQEIVHNRLQQSPLGQK